MLAGRVFNPSRVDEVVVTGLFPAHYGKGVGDTLTIQLPTPSRRRYRGLGQLVRPGQGPEDQGRASSA